MRLSFAISLLWFSSVITALNPCYFPDGTPSSDVLCPSSERCCPSGSTCMSNGLCQDVNNHNNDGTVNGNLNGAAFNSTGLYEAGTCQSTGNCDIISCPNLNRGGQQNIWACNKELTSYCCVVPGGGNLTSPGCEPFKCTNVTIALPSPVALALVGSSTTSLYPGFTSTGTPVTAKSSTSSSASASTGTISSNGSSLDNNGSHTSGLSSGAKAGIAIGAVLVVLPAVAIFFLLRRKRAKSLPKSSHGPILPSTEETYQKAELEGSSGFAYGNNPQTHPRAELEATTSTTMSNVHELSGYPPSSAGTPSIAELRAHPATVAGTPSVAELPALRTVAEMSEHQLLQDQRTFEETPDTNESRETKARALAQLEARKAKIAEEKERIARLERLDEEDRRIEEEMERIRNEL